MHVVDYMIAKSGGSHDRDGVTLLLLDTMERLMRTSPLVWQPGARAILTDARSRGLPTALVSASWNRLIDAVSERIRSDIGQVAFDAVVAGDDVTESKPHPEPYLTAAQLLGVAAQDCLALEDSPPGVVSALGAGCRVVAIPHVAQIDAPDAFVVESLEGWTIASLWAAAQD